MEKLKIKLATYGERVERFMTNLLKTGKDKRTEAFYNARLQLLNDYWTQYLKCYDDLWEVGTSEELKEDECVKGETCLRVESAYIETSAWIAEQLQTFRPKSASGDVSLNHTTSANSTMRGNQLAQAIKLPKISLPSFSGSYLEWPAFRDTYTSLIHDNSSLSQVQKLHYLKSSLSGEASKLLQHLVATEANYAAAWEILTERYNNTRILVGSYLSALVSLPPMSSETATELRRVVDSFTQHVRALENLKRPVEQWNDWLVYFLSNKLEVSTRKDWEASLTSSAQLPAFEDLKLFLERRIHTLNAIRSPITTASRGFNKAFPASNSSKSTAKSFHLSASSQRCILCQQKHFILFCPQFRAKSVEGRIATVQERGLCSNCLRSNHNASNCGSEKRCKICQNNHHTMLHKTGSMSVQGTSNNTPTSSHLNSTVKPSSSNTTAITTKSSSDDQISSAVSSHLVNNQRSTTTVLLATAIVAVRSADGRLVKARALIDQGSECNFITSALANLLRLPKHKLNVTVNGIGAAESGAVKAYVWHDIVSTVDSTCCYTVRSLVMPTLTQQMPSKCIVGTTWPHISGLALADPEFGKPGRVDMILGVDIYAQILRGEMRRGEPDFPMAQLTTLGWILSGTVDSSPGSGGSVTSLHISTADIDAVLKRFWEMEEPPKVCHLTPEEQDCEKFFADTHCRNAEGRYIIRLPLKQPFSSLGQSKGFALSALKRVESRLSNDHSIYSLYSAFMKEYQDLGHMTPVEQGEGEGKAYYLPHHAVVKPSSITTKLRVVFNASRRTSLGLSLNDILHTGPKLQTDVFTVILRWRFFPFVYAADIEKMFRQILVDERDRDMQRILWRASSTEAVCAFRLCTVTYGTACAPYLACKVLQQLAVDYYSEHHQAASILQDNFYVDDALFGAYDKQTAIRHRDELRRLLQLGGLKLRKWVSNSHDLLADIPVEDRELKESVQILSDPQIKTLGINWSPTTDQFNFHIGLPESSTISKRSVLSDIGRLYDPLGWLSPVVINAKVFLQKLWLAKVEWDEILPENMHGYWSNFKQSLTLLKDIPISRWIGTTNESTVGVELHGFCDASMQAYGAVVYLRVMHDFGNVQVSLLAAKTRVSPLKTVSLPRLELCGAALLAQLMQHLQQEMRLERVPTYLWTDSTVVLAWLKEHPSKWTTYVANRVAHIHRLTPDATWRHVRSSDNSADCISRGVPTDQLRNLDLWWAGPAWLKQHSSTWPSSHEKPTHESIHEELRPAAVFLSQQQPSEVQFELLYGYSSLRKLLRITALCLRFIQNLRKTKRERNFGTLRLSEIDIALTTWIKLTQQQAFPELNLIRNKRSLPSTSRLLKLQPFLDEQQVLRVGGRLRESLLKYVEKHPIILPKESHLTKLIIQHAHLATLHGGVQLTLHNVRSQYWILKGRSKVRQIVRDCVVCCRHGARTATQVMGDLPSDRVRPSKPFSIAGVDYAGPFNVTPVRRRGCKGVKSYVAIFICLVTRAIHIELVMDLTSEAFVAAYRRFVSRRGRCCRLYSDNATYFVAANKELSSNIRQLAGDETVINSLLDQGTDWHFMPPAAPHFGGIWEAGVRSFKHHFRRIVNDHILSVEEMLTLLAQIEACLNSRPIHALSDDPNDLYAITPGHFLVGESLSTVPAPSILDTSKSHLNRWQQVQHMFENLWQRWYKDYLHHLQLRGKWHQKTKSIPVGSLVLIKDDRLPPSKWLLGRVTEVHPGKDGHTRVVSVRHKEGILKRPITKLCVLPIQAETDGLRSPAFNPQPA